MSFFQKGRALSSRDGRYFVSIGSDVIPASWADHPLIGEEFVGTPFSEHPDAEETYKDRINAGEDVGYGAGEWGKGPAISTTYNYTGLAIPSEIDGAAPAADAEPTPVRISFLRSTKKAHDKLVTLKRSTMRGKSWWDKVFEFETSEKTFGRNTSHIVSVKKVRDTTNKEKALAIEIAQAVMSGRTQGNDEAAGDGPVTAPDAKGGLAV